MPYLMEYLPRAYGHTVSREMSSRIVRYPLCRDGPLVFRLWP